MKIIMKKNYKERLEEENKMLKEENKQLKQELKDMEKYIIEYADGCMNSVLSVDDIPDDDYDE